MHAVIERRAPALLSVGVHGGWAGLHEMSPDHNALVGEARDISRFVYATGFSGHGFQQAPAIGQTVRDLVLNRVPALDLAALSADRFAQGAARAEFDVI